MRDPCEDGDENCAMNELSLSYPKVSKKFIYWMAGMQFCNAVLPGVYYAVIKPKPKNYDDYDDDESDFAIVGKGAGRRRRRALKNIWSVILSLHSAIWGSGFLLFLLSFIGQGMRNAYRFYIEHLLSNLNYLTYLTVIVLLVLSAARGAKGGYIMLAIYALIFSGLIYFVELIMGVRSM